MTSTQLDLLLAGISTICAIIGIPASISAFNNKKEVVKIKEEIETYRKEIIKKNDLIMLVPKIELIKKLSKTFSNISTRVIPQPGENKSELDYYAQIKNEINDILSDIPEEYIEIRNIVTDIKKALGHCIENKKGFDELDRNSQYSYLFVEDKFSNLLTKLNTLVREIKF